jgi:hypothetical protein
LGFFPLFCAEVAVRHQIHLLASLLLALTQTGVRADGFWIKGDDVNWLHNSGESVEYVIRIDNPTLNPDLIALWGLNLTISPATDETTGNVFVVGIYQPSVNYLFEGRDAPLVSTFDGPCNSIAMIGAMDSSLAGVTVPENGYYLFALELEATNNALGTFALTVTPSESSSFWAGPNDINEDGINVHSFDNLPFDISSPITIGTITIQSVPEPASFAILLTGLGICGLQWIRQWCSNHY